MASVLPPPVMGSKRAPSACSLSPAPASTSPPPAPHPSAPKPQGVVKALFEARMLPRVLAGSSVGSIVAGIIATRTDDELAETFAKLESFDISFFNNSRAVELVHHFLARGVLHDMSYLQVCVFGGGVAGWDTGEVRWGRPGFGVDWTAACGVERSHLPASISHARMSSI
jgi:hypothetical protein